MYKCDISHARESRCSGTFEKLIDITEYPDLGGEKEKLDVTTLSDTKKRTINGIEDTGDLAFKAWYEKADYKKLLDLQEAGKVDKYQLWFGEEGVDGKWEWAGVMAVYPDKRIFQQCERNVILHY